jgi:hypothetical protein
MSSHTPPECALDILATCPKINVTKNAQEAHSTPRAAGRIQFNKHRGAWGDWCVTYEKVILIPVVNVIWIGFENWHGMG